MAVGRVRGGISRDNRLTHGVQNIVQQSSSDTHDPLEADIQAG